MKTKKINFTNPTFGAWLSFWFETYKKPYLKPNSTRNIEQVIRLHTVNWLKAIPLKEVTVFDIDGALVEIPLGRTRQYARQVWHSAFVKAQKLGLIEQNAVALSEPVKYKKRRGKALTITEQTVFINALNGKRIKWLMLFYLFSGVRRSEALAIEWADIDEENGLILIKGTKTEESYRYILLTDNLREILAEQRKQIERDIGTRYQSKRPEIIFDYSASYVSQAFKKICSTHKLHNLRHNYITRCAESGMNVSVCQQLVGHSSPEMTLRIYTHIFDEFKRSEALKFSIEPQFNS